VKRATVFSAFLAAAILVAVPMGAALGKKKPPERLYDVSLSGSLEVQWTSTVPVSESPMPEFCDRHADEARHFTAYAKISTTPKPTNVSYYGRNFPRLIFKSRLKPLTATVTTEMSGEFTPDPQLDPHPNPGDCAFNPKPEQAECAYYEQGRAEKGAHFQLSPSVRVKPTVPLERGNRLFLYGPQLEVQCKSGYIVDKFFEERESIETALRVGRILSLGKGRTASTSETAVFPAGEEGGSEGSEKIVDSIKVKRVR
jgi:hypothetical protein